MKLKYIDKKELNDILTTDRIYPVICIDIIWEENFKPTFKVYIVEDNGSTFYTDLTYFEIIEGGIPKDWEFINNVTYQSFLPKEINYDSFFEDLSNDDVFAIQQLKKVFPNLKLGINKV